jgi:hypothetical protein
MAEFWRASGFDLLDRTEAGALAVTDDFLRAYLARPEMAPVAESCKAERALHAALLDDPRRMVTAVHLVAIKDRDARENYDVFVRYRDWLVRHRTVEAAYAALFRAGDVTLPGLFLDQMAAAILRGLLDGADDPFRARAAELLFRAQKIDIQDGRILAADEETVDMLAATGGLGAIGRLIVEAGTPPRRVDLDVLTEANAAAYWARSDRHDTVLDLTFAHAGIDALARVLEAWTRHLTGAAVSIQPVQAINDPAWAWYVGLDAEANAILTDMYEGRTIDDARAYRVLSLFRLEFADPARMLPRVAGKPVYLAMAMTEAKRLRLKPQNLVVNLPLAPAQ